MFSLWSLFQKVPSTSVFFYENFFDIFKDSMRILCNDEDESQNFSKVCSDKKLQKQLSKILSQSYEDEKKYNIMVRENSLRSDILFYSLFSGFILSFFMIVFFRNRLSADALALVSGVAGVSGNCLKRIFEHEFSHTVYIQKSLKYYLLDSIDLRV